jgi:hypothetical protein
MHRLTMTALALALVATPALADRPPADALPLSEIVRMVEEARDVDYVKEVDWDDDDDHWEIEYVREGGGEVEIEVDPRTGRIRD